MQQHPNEPPVAEQGCKPAKTARSRERRHLSKNEKGLPRMEEVRCGNCHRKLAVATFTEIQIKCPRCGTLNHLKATEPPNSSAKSARLGGRNDKPNHSLDRRQAQAR